MNKLEKYCILIQSENTPFVIRKIPNNKNYFLIDSYQILNGSREKDIQKECLKIERKIEEILDSEIRVKFDILIDETISEHRKTIQNILGDVRLVNLKEVS